MGTEILKEQYDLLMSEQKAKLDNLRKKKQQQQSVGKDLVTSYQADMKYDQDEEDDVNDDIYPKFDLFDKPDSSDDEFRKPPASKSINKSQKSSPSKSRQSSSNVQFRNDSHSLNSIRESLSFADKLREMNDENGRLRKVLAEKDYEITSLRKKLEDERAVLGSFNSDAAATKIVDLAKKVRELTAQLESEKSRNKQLNKNVKDLEEKCDKLTDIGRGKNELDDEPESEEKRMTMTRENKELKDKLNQTCHKMMEYKSQCEILKQDVKKYQKALEKELGDNVDIKSVLSGQGGWRGRQQQIRNLQSKVNELKQQIGMMDARSSQILDEEDLDEASSMMRDMVPKSAAQMSMYSGFMSSNVGGSQRTGNIHKNDFRRLDRERKENSEKLKKEFEALEGDYNVAKEKLEAMKARNAVLANENKTVKEQVKTLLEKGKHDDELIEALMKKQNQLKEVLEKMSVQNEQASKEIDDKVKEVQIKSMQEKNTVEQLKNIIAERDRRINQLEEDLEDLRENMAVKRMTSTDPFYLATKTESKTENTEFVSTTIVKPASAANRSDSVDRETLNSRNSMRSGKTTNRPGSSSGGFSKLVDQKKEQSLDLKKENSELRTLHKTSEIERLRLLDLVKTQQKRIEELNERAIESENKLNEQRRRSANLEKQLEKMKLQDSKSNSKSSKPQPNTATIDQYKMEELETSLLIQRDENDALKAALKSTLEAKEEDLRLYCEMLESTKQVFLDGLKQYKQISTGGGN